MIVARRETITSTAAWLLESIYSGLESSDKISSTLSFDAHLALQSGSCQTCSGRSKSSDLKTLMGESSAPEIDLPMPEPPGPETVKTPLVGFFPFG